MNNSDGTGYTPEQINTLNGNLAEAYNNFGNVIADGWPSCPTNNATILGW